MGVMGGVPLGVSQAWGVVALLESSAKVGCGVQPPPQHLRQAQRSPIVLVIPSLLLGGKHISPSYSMFSSPLVVLGEHGALLWEKGLILLSQELSG